MLKMQEVEHHFCMPSFVFIKQIFFFEFMFLVGTAWQRMFVRAIRNLLDDTKIRDIKILP